MTVEEYITIEALYLEMYEFLMTYTRSSLENEALAEEAVQEAFRIACTKPHELLASPNPKGWMINAVKNAIRNSKRVRANANRLMMAYTSTLGEEGACATDQVSLEVIYGDLAKTEEFKLIKEMAIDGKSHLEMAQSRGISVDACKKRVQRAKKFLRKRI